MRHAPGSFVALLILSIAACTSETPKAPDTSSVVTTPAPAPTPPAPAADSTKSAPVAEPTPQPSNTVTAHGIGALRAGMTLAEARSAVGKSFVVKAGTDTTACGYAEWRGGPPGVAVMIEEARIARIEVRSGSVATAEGARIGDSEERVKSLYPGRVAVTPHKYTAGHYLTVTPAAAADSNYRIIFETDKGKVARYRAGRLPPVGYVEGCS